MRGRPAALELASPGASSGGPLRAGVVGVGHLGAHHARIYSQLPGVELVGVVDRDASRAAAVATETGCRVMSSVGELGLVVDALSIAVPAQLHAEVAIPCLERGVAVLIEKPMAASVREAEEIGRAASASGAPLMVGHVERWNGAFRRIAARIRHPRFIEGHRLSSFAGRGLDVDVIFDLMIHDLDLIASFTSAELTQVAAVGVPVLTTTADIANARLEFADGLVANLTASRVSRERLRKLRIFQADAYISIDFVARSAEVVRRNVEAIAQDSGLDPNGALDPQRLLAHEMIDATADAEPLQAEIEAFVAAVRNGRTPAPGAEEGLRAVALAERVAAEMADRADERPGAEAPALAKSRSRR